MVLLNLYSGIYLTGFTFIIFSVIVLGGGIVAWFSDKHKLRYSLYYGVIVAILLYTFLWGFFTNSFYLFLIPLLGCVGGYIIRNDENNLKKLFKNKFQFDYKSFF